MKNSKNLKKQIVILVIILFAVAELVSFYLIQMSVNAKRNNEQTEHTTYVRETVLDLYRTNTVLYKNSVELSDSTNVKGVAEIFSVGESYQELDDTQISDIEENYSQWQSRSDNILNGFDVYARFKPSNGEDICYKNTDYDLKSFCESQTSQQVEQMKEKYCFYVIMNYDKNGVLSIEPIWNEDGEAGEFIKMFQYFEREYRELQYDIENYELRYKGIHDFSVIYACPRGNDNIQLSYKNTPNEWYEFYYAYLNAGGGYMHYGILLLLTIFAFIMNFQHNTKEDLSSRKEEERKFYYHAIIRYPTELALILIYCTLTVFPNLSYKVMYDSNLITLCSNIKNMQFREITVEQLVTCSLSCLIICITMFLSYFAVYSLVPLFRMGILKYLKEYSFCFHFLPWTKSLWKRWSEMIRHVDLTQKANRVILRIVILNFIVLAIVTCFWFGGIVILIIYSIVLYFLLRKYYIGVSRDYQILLKAMGKIADGELDTQMTEDIGLFEPFKQEMGEIQVGFKKAVSQEVKSTKMKTELITNVSHDLKTPLTAITTYIELLQQEGITEEQRKEYTDTLQKKAKRLTTLIEDLFEVSKANTENVTMNFQEVDLISLIRQTGVEFEDRLAEKNLEINYRLPEEKIKLMLDGQKTYRVFENLYGNIVKYAMPSTRVYVDVTEQDNKVVVIIRNISAYELNFRADEITERFARGDQSRNSEGSGLGLAIAKSFTELQKGKFDVFIDGDLFKVVLIFNRISTN